MLFGIMMNSEETHMYRFESYSKPRMSFLAFLLTAFVAGCGSGSGAPDPILGTAPGATGVVGSGMGNPGPAGFAPALGAAAAFGGFSGSGGMTNTGTFTVITGAQGQPVAVGTRSVSTSMTGFHDTAGCVYTETPANIGTVNGTINTAAPPPGVPSAPICSDPALGEGNGTTAGIALAAFNAAQAAFNDLAGRPGGMDPGANLSGLTLAPGVYKTAGGAFLLQGGADLTLDAQGNQNAVWVFQMASTLTVGGPGVAAPRSVILAGGAQPKNVFWQVGSAATINAAGGSGGTMVGTIISMAGTSFSTAGQACCTTLNGRALALTASVTMANTVINVPTP
jgi:hypothetical protein